MDLSQKLQLKPGQQLHVLNAPPGMLSVLAENMPGIEATPGAGEPSDAVLLFVHNLAETAHLVPQAIAAVEPDALFWVAYPKGSSGVPPDLNRDRLWKAVTPTGWRPVRQVALDETWSAMRFRPADRVGKS